MASIADELLNDFEDSGSEHEDNANGFHDGDNIDGRNGPNVEDADVSGSLDGDTVTHDEDMEDAEEEVAAADAARADIADDEDDTKAKVEKMRLGGVRDVRNVAGLMKTLQPVLEVSTSLPLSKHYDLRGRPCSS